MMRLRTMLALSMGFGAGYVAGASAGQPAYDRMRSATANVAAQLGLTDAGKRIRERGDDLARASADLASQATRDVVDNAADKVEQQLIDAQSRMQGGSSNGGSHV
jgi:hypothetical protein